MRWHSNIDRISFHRVCGLTVRALVKELQRRAETILPTSPEEFEDFIESLEKAVHPNHFVVLSVKRKLLDVYRLTPDPEDLTALRKKLDRQLQLGE